MQEHTVSGIRSFSRAWQYCSCYFSKAASHPDLRLVCLPVATFVLSCSQEEFAEARQPLVVLTDRKDLISLQPTLHRTHCVLTLA